MATLAFTELSRFQFKNFQNLLKEPINIKRKLISRRTETFLSQINKDTECPINLSTEIKWYFRIDNDTLQLPPIKFPPGQSPLGLLPHRQLPLNNSPWATTTETIVPMKFPPGQLPPHSYPSDNYPWLIPPWITVPRKISSHKTPPRTITLQTFAPRTITLK